MASYYIPLPAPEMPRNALLDFSPIRQAAQDWRQADQDEYERKRQEMLDKRVLANQEYERGRNALSDKIAAQKYQWEIQDRNKPKLMELNGSLVSVDPITYQTKTLYSKPDALSQIFGNSGNSGINALSPQSMPLPQNNEPQPRLMPQSFNMPRVENPIAGATVQYVSDQPNQQQTEMQSSSDMTLPETPKERTVTVFGRPITEQQAWAMSASDDMRARNLGNQILERFKTDPTGTGLQKETIKKIDENQMDTVELLSNLTSIKNSYKPEYLQWKTQLDALGTWAKRKAGIAISDDEKEAYQGYVNFKKNTVSNLNDFIRKMTGAAMSNAEADRLKAEVPTENDDDLAFETKLDSSLEKSLLAAHRYHYFRVSGIPYDMDKISKVMPLSNMKNFMNAQAKQIQEKLLQQNPTLKSNPAKLKQETRNGLIQLFGGVDI